MVRHDHGSSTNAAHTHTYNGVTHTHTHMNGNIEHTHAHMHNGEAHTHAAPNDPDKIREIIALLSYMVSHNDAHAQELAELADGLHTIGRDKYYNEIMEVVTEFDMANARLDALLSALRIDCIAEDAPGCDD